MTKEELNDEYLEWMYNIVCDDNYADTTYHYLFACLYDIEFIYVMPMDASRAEDGVDLRYRFGYDRGYDQTLIASYLDDHPCSVLEMMVALSIRCEEHIMDNPDLGNRVGQWFWTMIVNLELGEMTDSKFDVDYVENQVCRFMYRDIERDGKGGLFRIHNPRRDMRTADIWYQLNWYLSETTETTI